MAAVAATLAFKDLAALSSGLGSEPWSRGLFGFRLNAAARAPLRIHYEAKGIDVVLLAAGQNKVWVEIGDRRLLAELTAAGVSVDGVLYHGDETGEGGQVAFEAGAAFLFSRYTAGEADLLGGGDGTILAPMPGRIVSVGKGVGSAVQAGETVLTLEAMKMEHALDAPFDGVVAEVTVNEGDQVAERSVVVRLEPVG